MKYILTIFFVIKSLNISFCQNPFFELNPASGSDKFFSESDDITIIIDSTMEDQLLKTVADILSRDIKSVFSCNVNISYNIKKIKGSNLIIIGTTQNKIFPKQYVNAEIQKNKGKWEYYNINYLATGNIKTLVVCGSDPRGAAYGVMEICRQIGVSPWYWWADVPVSKKKELYIKRGLNFSDGPKVKYRGIFINDEAPALSNWSKEKFGGFNSKFYEKVFELMIRLKSNYIWPAMWGNAFYDDDPENIKTAEKYNIVIGTSHHEPLMRAHDEWRRYHNKSQWNYITNSDTLRKFWTGGLERARNEKIVSVGMRGDGDEPMSRETATELLETIVSDQRKIIEDVTGKPASHTPQLWALYKEVLDYYDKGMKVPDDITLLFCDDNWGNVRRLPAPDAPKRKGGYGIYYHFDYVGGPRNYKWINTNYLPRIWDQMLTCYQHDVKDIWIVNVGDIKPMELPVSFFIDMAWNPERFKYQDVQNYFKDWSKLQFGDKHFKQIADVIQKSSKLLAIRKPELITSTSFSIDEFTQLIEQLILLEATSKIIWTDLGENYESSYFQLVHHPIEAMVNLLKMYQSQALNQYFYEKKHLKTNFYSRLVRDYFIRDSLISLKYHTINNGKWNHMMSQTHIGYTSWQQPLRQIIPNTFRLSFWEEDRINKDDSLYIIPFENKTISLDLEKAITVSDKTNSVKWELMQQYGKYEKALSTFPFNHPSFKESEAPYFEINFSLEESDFQYITLTHSPNLDIYGKGGLKYSIKINEAPEKIFKLNENDGNTYNWEYWVAESGIQTVINSNKLQIGNNKIIIKHLDPCIILQDITISKNKKNLPRFK